MCKKCIELKKQRDELFDIAKKALTRIHYLEKKENLEEEIEDAFDKLERYEMLGI